MTQYTASSSRNAQLSQLDLVLLHATIKVYQRVAIGHACAICAPRPCANFGSVLITYSSGLSSQAAEIFQSSCYCHHPWSQGPKWVVEKMPRHTGSEATSVKLGKADCSSALEHRTVSRCSAFRELESMNTVVQELRNQEQCKRSASQTSAGFDGAYHRRRYPPAPSFGPLNLTFTLSSQEICPIPTLSPLVYQNNHHRCFRKWCVPCLSKPNFLLRHGAEYQVILVSTLQKTNCWCWL